MAAARVDRGIIVWRNHNPQLNPNENKMKNILQWLQTHKFEAQVIAFALMILPPIPLYFAARQGATAWIWVLLAPVILGNLLALAVK